MITEETPTATVLREAGLRVTDNHDRVARAIDHQVEDSHADNREILNRSQQRLQYEERRHVEIADEKKRRMNIVLRTKRHLARLQEVLETEQHNLADLEVEDASVLESVHSLRTKGVIL